MKKIDHLPKSEQEHFILCDCGEYLDMRNLAEVFAHQHADLPRPCWSYAVKPGTPIAYLPSGKSIDLN